MIFTKNFLNFEAENVSRLILPAGLTFSRVPIFNKKKDEKEAGLKLAYYICHRSGVANPTSNIIKHAKASGSAKCGFACLPMMTVSRRSIYGVTEINVQYQTVHVGHDIEAEKLHLMKDQL
ncbi:c2H2-type domain-containing protein [Nephila pilipes]|uniref:C2H2-type domain-containing protein n=1 Tax=Nephila pilipes TaxID=299642 RepID=A0A8X6IRY9_NEPPI|nr:c2H2-type domain-containing protein [Nephila pilipes]